MSRGPVVVRREHEIEVCRWTGQNFEECDRFVNGYLIRCANGEEVMLTYGLFSRKVAKKGDYIVKDGEFATVWSPEELAEKTTIVFRNGGKG